jgi:hypothetical protein
MKNNLKVLSAIGAIKYPELLRNRSGCFIANIHNTVYCSLDEKIIGLKKVSYVLS